MTDNAAKPVAWAALWSDGTIRFTALEEAVAKGGAFGQPIVPLYRQSQPLLTAREREEVSRAIRELESGISGYDNPYANTKRARAGVLRGLLERQECNDAVSFSCRHD
jgi:hypothetical protein